MNKFFLTFLLFNLQINSLSPIELVHPLVKNLDGNLIDGSAIMIQKQVLVSISTLVYGKRGDGTIGYNGSKISLQKLSIEERKLNMELKKGYSMDIKQAYHTGALGLPEDLQKRVKDLHVSFEDAKQQFKDATFPFLDRIQHYKDPIIKIMGEWCEKRKRKDSHILRWADAPPGAEEALFHSLVTTHNELNAFLYDIMVFVTDLCQNCPKANDQFNKYMKEKSATN